MLKKLYTSVLRLSSLAILAGILWSCGFVWFLATLPTPASPLPLNIDAIVVLTGGSDRIPAGLDLLDKGKAEKLFISGVYKGVEVREILTLSRKDPGRFSEAIILGYEAGNTHENAAEAAAWLKDVHARSFYLVTSSYHMHRAMLEFRLVLPKNIRIIPHVVAPAVLTADGWWRKSRLASLMAAEYTKYLLTLPKAIFLLAPTRQQNGTDP
ncbi:MAG TPA: YdcF family protein [Rhodospirillaceae bacterium]|nr:MAG: hypothetical protein A2018_01870 [Alphaproteobacteria bacterium GWF2_58_20]HAU29604.1 YdcF family protein [Rhodospirillaceae bacterium]